MRNTHLLSFDTPPDQWDEALPVGNGILGALIWGDGHPLNISLDRTDLWDLRSAPEFNSPECSYRQLRQWIAAGRADEISHMYDETYLRPSPTRLPAGRIQVHLSDGATFVDASLRLQDALATCRWKGDAQADIFLHAEMPVGHAVFRACNPIFYLVSPPFSGSGDLRLLEYPAPVEMKGDNWQAYTQQGALGFQFAVYLAWRTHEDGVHAAWSIATSFEGKDPLTAAQARVEAALNAEFTSLFTGHQKWWASYWDRSSVQLPNERLERQWYLEQYKFGAACRRGAPPISLQGPWTADDGKLPPWKGDYHHDLNTQLSYWPCYSANHLEEGMSYLDWLWQTRTDCQDWTRHFFDAPGLNVPGVSDLNNHPLGGWAMYSFSSTVAAWLSHHFYLHWRFSGDREFLRERVYPYLCDVAVFLETLTCERDAAGYRTLPLSASPEINDNRLEAWFPTITNYDLALVRWLFGATAELATELGLAEEATHWQLLVSELPDFAYGNDGRLLIGKDYPLPESHRHFSHLLAIHPLGLIDWEDGEQAQRTIRASLAELDRLGTDGWCGYSYAWLANLAARARDGERAERALDIFYSAFISRNSFHVNGDQSGQGYSKLTYRPFTLEGNFAAAAGIQEMLLQSHRGIIRVFPAIPAHWDNVSFTTLRAEGGFLVSARRSEGVTEWVQIRAEHGGTCRLVSPFSNAEIRLQLAPGEQIHLEADGLANIK
jgi:alpha-L-fucosidase 2